MKTSQERFHRREGWRPSNELSAWRAVGAVDAHDLISEAEAEALIAGLRDGE